MLAKVTSWVIIGLDGTIVEIEVDISRGLPSTMIVGLPDTAVPESRERVRTVITNFDLPFPSEHLTVNLVPTNLCKIGLTYDLPITISMVLASDQIYGDVSRAIVMGELSLDDSVRPISGALPLVNLARSEKFLFLFVPTGNTPKASLLEGLTIYPIESLLQLVNHFTYHQRLTPYKIEFSLKDDQEDYLIYAVKNKIIRSFLTQFYNQLGANVHE